MPKQPLYSIADYAELIDQNYDTLRKKITRLKIELCPVTIRCTNVSPTSFRGKAKRYELSELKTKLKGV